MINISFAIGALHRGGAETLLLNIFKSRIPDDFSVNLIHRKDGPLKNEFKVTNKNIFHLPVGKNYFTYLIRLRRILIKNNIQIIHAHQPIDVIYAKIASLGLDIKILLTLHGFNNLFTTEIARFILKKSLNLTNKNIYVSDFLRTYYTSKYNLNKYNQVVIYNGISFTNRISPNKIAVYKIRNELKIGKDVLLLGTVGNFNEVRNHYFICKFINLLKQSNINFHFVFIGAKVNYAPHLYDNCIDYCIQNNLNQQVSFLGAMTNIQTLLPQLDAFIYSSKQDTFGMAVVEAIAEGVPVFVNDWEVMLEINNNKNLMTIFKTNDELDLLNKFKKYIENKSVFIDNAKKASEFVRMNFSIDKHILELGKLYKSILNVEPK